MTDATSAWLGFGAIAAGLAAYLAHVTRKSILVRRRLRDLEARP
jgi:hypothetical protein